MLHLILVDLRRHAARTVLTASGIAVGVATIVALRALSAGIERSAAGLVNLGGAELGLFQGGVGELTASALPGSLAARVTREPGVAEATPIAVAPGELPGTRSFLVFGVEPSSFVVRQLVFLAGREPRRPDEVVVGDGAARQLRLRVGGRLRLSAGTFASSASATPACPSRTREPPCPSRSSRECWAAPGTPRPSQSSSPAGRVPRR